mmetsp:Transcript_12774/g.30018  ORF Transcript_12774/g.30018 Transcript_12774/m.30018 type:complete len:270 (-) Transcript_12774:287-1096(-)
MTPGAGGSCGACGHSPCAPLRPRARRELHPSHTPRAYGRSLLRRFDAGGNGECSSKEGPSVVATTANAYARRRAFLRIPAPWLGGVGGDRIRRVGLVRARVGLGRRAAHLGLQPQPSELPGPHALARACSDARAETAQLISYDGPEKASVRRARRPESAFCLVLAPPLAVSRRDSRHRQACAQVQNIDSLAHSPSEATHGLASRRGFSETASCVSDVSPSSEVNRRLPAPSFPGSSNRRADRRTGSRRRRSGRGRGRARAVVDKRTHSK